jgi:hypothetical protein
VDRNAAQARRMMAERLKNLHRCGVVAPLCLWGTSMLVTGNQLKAARALIGLEQADLAEAAGVHVNTIRKMDWKGAGEITSGADIVRKVQLALEAAGVEFLNHGQPGVQLRRATQ